ncbi:MAG TPA: hypothetical protein VIN40_02770 [Candidatus Tyrphobacter sp.]
MISRYIGIAAAAIAFGLCGSRTLADDVALTARVQAAYDAQCADVMRGDFAAFQATLSPNFTGELNGRTVTRDGVVTNLRNSASTISLSKCMTTIDSVQQSGGAVIAVVHQLIDGTLTSAQGTAPIEIAAGKRDMWTSAGDAFVQTSSMSIWSTVSVNGEIVQQTGTPPSAPPPSAAPAPNGTPAP